jgi:zinc protease
MQLVSSAIFARDSQQTMADIFGRAAMLGLPPQEVIDWTRAIEAVTPEDVRRAAQELLRVEHSLSGHLSGARAKESR